MFAFRLLLLCCCLGLILAQRLKVPQGKKCLSVQHKSLDDLLLNPPAIFHLDCITQSVIDEFVQNPTHTRNVVSCLDIIDEYPCTPNNPEFRLGYRNIALAIDRTMGVGGSCSGRRSKCSSSLRNAVQYAMGQLNIYAPDDLTRGLGLLAN